MIARNSKREPHAACRRSRQTKRGPTGFNVEWKSGIESDGEVGWTGDHCCVRPVFQFERQALAFLTGIENGHAGYERNLGRTLVKDFSLQLQRALDGLIGDAEFQVRALQSVRNGRSVQFSRLLAGEFEEPVVFVEGKRDVSRGWHGRRRYFVRRCKTRENQHSRQEDR